jgi:hypothetical protein
MEAANLNALPESMRPPTPPARPDRFGGREVKTTGDGLLATFDGPVMCPTVKSPTSTILAARKGSSIVSSGCSMFFASSRGMSDMIAVCCTTGQFLP